MTTKRQSGLLLDVEQAAEALGRPATEVRDLIASGAIPAVRLSPRRLRVPRAALEAWLDDHAQRALGDLR